MNDEGMRQQVSCGAKHQSPEAKEGRNYLKQKSQPGPSRHGHIKRSPPCETAGNPETSPEAVDLQETPRQRMAVRPETMKPKSVGRNVPGERKVLEVEADPKELWEERQVQQHEEARAASSGSRA